MTEPMVMVARGSKRQRNTHWWMSLSRNGKRVGWVSACGKRTDMLFAPYLATPTCKHCRRAG